MKEPGEVIFKRIDATSSSSSSNRMRPFVVPLLVMVASVIVGVYLSDRLPLEWSELGISPSSENRADQRAESDAQPASATHANPTPSPAVREVTAVPVTQVPDAATMPRPLDESSPPVAPPAPLAPVITVAPGDDLSGSWTVNTRVESSSLRDTYEGLQLGYRLQLQQSGDRITGLGVKILPNGRALGERGETPIEIEGTMSGNRITLMLTERGAERQSAGKMILSLQEGGVLRGRFSGDAAGSSGLAEARRRP
jgi:hypothetical protein